MINLRNEGSLIEKRALVFLLMSARLFIDERSFVYKWFCILMQMQKRLLKNAEVLSNSHVILNDSEGSQRLNMRFFLPTGRQNDKMIVDFHFETPSFAN